jgi:hypothetical protein
MAVDTEARAAITAIENNSLKVNLMTDVQKAAILNTLFPERVHAIANGDLIDLQDKDGNLITQF